MIKLTKRYIVKIPKKSSVYFSEKYQALVLAGSLKKIIIKLRIRVILSEKIKIIKVLDEPFTLMSQNKKRQLKAFQRTFVAMLKHALNEISTFTIKKLKLIGVGYKAFIVKASNYCLLHLKIGYSHPIFIKISKTIAVFCLKSNSKIYLKSNLYLYVSQIAALLRSYKTPEPYKGKGIFHSEESIKLKEGKKI